MNIDKINNREKAEQEALATLGMYALERNDLEAILHRAIQQCCIILELECAVICMLNPEGTTLEVSADAGCSGDCKEIENDEKWDMGYALKSGDPIRVSNYAEEDRFRLSPIMDKRAVTSAAHINIRGTEDSYGVFGFYTRERREFTDEDLNFIKIIAHILGMAIERSRSQQELEEKNKQLKDEMSRSRRYQQEVLKNNISERWKLGRYLHDNLAQMLVSAKIKIDNVLNQFQNEEASEELHEVIDILEEGISGIRDLTNDIIPIDIEEDGVKHSLETLMRQAQKLHKIDCSMNVEDVVDQIENIELATNLYHIIQEAVKNAAIHGRANKVIVEVKSHGSNLVLQIKDNGHGLTNGEADDGEDNGKGIRIMKHRMEVLGGEMSIEEWSENGESGTSVKCLLPLRYLSPGAISAQ